MSNSTSEVGAGESPALAVLQRRRPTKEKTGQTANSTRRQLELLNKYLRLLRRSGGDQQSFMPLVERVGQIRQLVITEGLPEDGLEMRLSAKRRWTHQCSLRGLVWKVLLGTYHVDALFYIKLVEAGASSRDAKIRDDTFRTFKTDELFHLRVHEDMMARVLNAFVRLNFADEATTTKSGGGGGGGAKDTAAAPLTPPPPPPSSSSSSNGSSKDAVANAGASKSGVGGRYVQGMNVLCGIFLYVMPEMDAFFSFNSLLTRHCPGYITANLDGVHVGCDLVDRCLALLDPVLHSYLKKKSVGAQVFAFPLLLSLFACLPPLNQVLLVWDVLFAYGVHLDVLMCVAQVLSLRDSLLIDPSPMMSLRPEKLPPLDAPALLSLAFDLIPLLPDDLYREIAIHPFVVSRESRTSSKQQPSSSSSMSSSSSSSLSSSSHTADARSEAVSSSISPPPVPPPATATTTMAEDSNNNSNSK